MAILGIILQADISQVLIELIRQLPLIITAFVSLVTVTLAVKTYLDNRSTRKDMSTLKTDVVEVKENQGKNRAELAKVTENVETLATNIDGKMDKYVEEVRRAERSVGQQEGGEAERSRPPELITEPAKVHDALNGKEVLRQIAAIDDHLTVVDATSTRIEEAGKAATARADKHEGAEPGVAADAAVKSPKE